MRSLMMVINHLNAQLNPFSHLLALLGAHHILHDSRVRVKPKHVGAVLISIFNVNFKTIFKRIQLCITW